MVEKTELILICLVAVALLAIVARKIRVPYPILLTIGGVVLALVPGLPAIHLDPQLVFNLFLPPLLYPAAVYTSWRDFRANLRSILPLAIVLVLLTMTATAYLFHGLVGLPLAVGFVFGAIISPPDAVAALAVTQTLRVPRKIIVILEGESLINDATSFISFRFAVAAVMTGAFSLGQASLQFLFVAAGGICVGLAVGWLATQLQKRLDDPPVQTMFSLLTPYVAYFSGERLHVSGILAVVIAGIYYGWRAPRILSGRMRLQALPVWEMVTFILNGILFMLVGLQLPQVISALAPGTVTRVADRVTEKEERLARLKANEAALARLEAIESSNRARPKTVERLRSEYEDRIRQLRSEAPDEESVRRLFSEDFEELAREVLQTERDTVIELRNEEAINDQALRRIQRDIDLAEARLQRPARKSR